MNPDLKHPCCKPGSYAPARRLAAFLAACAACLIACGPAFSADEIAKRLQALEKSDWNAWIDEAEKLSADGRARAVFASRHLLEAVARAGDIESANRALRMLASLHRSKTQPSDLKAASRILVELARKTGDSGLIAEIEDIRGHAIPEKKKLLAEADESRARGDFSRAGACLIKALLLPFDIPSEVGPRIDDDAVRRMLLEVFAADGARFAQWSEKPARCAECAGKGVTICDRCNGRGKVRRSGSGPGTGTVLYETCSRCSGLGILMCKACKGSGCNFDALTQAEASAFGEFMDAARRITLVKDVEDALAQAQNFILACGLDLPPTFLPVDTDVRHLFPFRSSTNVSNELKGDWRENPERKFRIRLLTDFGVNAVRELRPLRHMIGLSRTATPPRMLHQSWSETAPLPLSEISMFPEFWHDRFVSIRGEYQGKSELLGFDAGEFLKIDAGSHDVAVVAWKPVLKSQARSISEIHKGFKSMAAFSHIYPFESVESAFAALSPGSSIEVFGRFVHSPDRVPRKLLEAFWIGTGGGAPQGAREGKAEPSPAPVSPGPGPLLDASEEWQLGRTRVDDLLCAGMSYLRRATELEDRVMSAPSAFAEKGEEYVNSLQKARAFLEKALERENSDALRSLCARINSKIITAIETARAR